MCVMLKRYLRKLGMEHNSLPYLQDAYEQRDLQGWANELRFA